jgi:hypothetical protein
MKRADSRIGTCSVGGVSTSVLPSDRGCDYCADEQNMGYGHVTQIGSDEARGTLLLRCPRCRWLYETDPIGVARPAHLSEEEARNRFAAWR